MPEPISLDEARRRAQAFAAIDALLVEWMETVERRLRLIEAGLQVVLRAHQRAVLDELADDDAAGPAAA